MSSLSSITPIWVAVLSASAICFILKYLGYSIPKSFLTHPRLERINTLIPVVLLSALIAVQSVSKKAELVVDQRLAGVGVGLIALMLKAPFPIVVISSALTSAIIYRYL